MTVPAGLAGEQIRVELSNRFGDQPIVIGRVAVGVRGRFRDAAFEEAPSVSISAAGTRSTDPIDLSVGHGDEIVVDVYLPEPTPYVTVGGFQFDRSAVGDFAGAHLFPTEGIARDDVDATREFPAANADADPQADGSGWSLPAGGPWLRTIELSGRPGRAVLVALGGSSTAMGWPQ